MRVHPIFERDGGANRSKLGRISMRRLRQTDPATLLTQPPCRTCVVYSLHQIGMANLHLLFGIQRLASTTAITLGMVRATLEAAIATHYPGELRDMFGVDVYLERDYIADDDADVETARGMQESYLDGMQDLPDLPELPELPE
jgi:hypothetical protein